MLAPWSPSGGDSDGLVGHEEPLSEIIRIDQINFTLLLLRHVVYRKEGKDSFAVHAHLGFYIQFQVIEMVTYIMVQKMT